MSPLKVFIKIHRDGREVLNLRSPYGRAVYRNRVETMWKRQKGLCCLCNLPLALDQATFEHQDGKGMNGSHRDDRVVKDGKPYNGAACWKCNHEKGSKRINYHD